MICSRRSLSDAMRAIKAAVNKERVPQGCRLPTATAKSPLNIERDFPVAKFRVVGDLEIAAP